MNPELERSAGVQRHAEQLLHKLEWELPAYRAAIEKAAVFLARSKPVIEAIFADRH